MTRRDVHAPGSADFDPEAYQLRGVFDLNPDWPNPNATRARLELVNGLIAQGYRIGAHGSRQCGHCGAHIRYAALMVREDVKQYIWIGETCLDNRFDLTKGEFDALRKQGQLDRERQRLLTAFRELCEQHPALAEATYAENIEISIERDLNDLAGQKVLGYRDQQALGTTAEDHRLSSGTSYNTSVAADIARKARRYGSVSDKQVALVAKLLGEIESKVEAYRQKIAARSAAPTVPALTEGRQVVEGVVLSRKEQEGYFPGTSTWKMTVKLDGGQRVYGTEPGSLYVEQGDRVRFTATVEPQADDPSFGFFKRPTKAEVVAPFAKAQAA